MILEYHRPVNIEAAMELLKRKSPITRALAGGTLLNQKHKEDFAVVDLQDLGLNHVSIEKDHVTVGAMVTLQQIVEHPELGESLRNAARADASINIRNIATIGGTIAGSAGNSVLLAVLSALSSEIEFYQIEKSESIGDLLPLRTKQLNGKLITQISYNRQVKVAWDKISRTPSDQADLVVSVARWPNGRTRVVVGDRKSGLRLAMDGTTSEGAEIAAKNLYSGVDEYFYNMAQVLTNRCLKNLEG